MPLPTPPSSSSHNLTAEMNARYSAANLLNPPPPPPVPQVACPTRTSAKISTATENNQHYLWPDKSKLAPKTSPVLNSQKSKVVIGMNHPAAMRLKKGTANVPFRSAHAPRSVRSSNGDDDSFPESEFQSCFAAVHPERSHPAPAAPVLAKENVPSSTNNANLNMSETGSAASSKYQLMSQELKARRQEGGTRSDYTTGVYSAGGGAHSAHSTSGSATTSRAATAGSNHEAFATTANTTMSADSLARTTQRVSSGLYNGIPGT